MTDSSRDKNAPGFLGKGWSFPVRFETFLALSKQSGVQQRLRLVTVDSLDDIIESLLILFQTRPGERVMQPNYGCDLQGLMFEPMDSETEAAIEHEIERAVRFFEARIDLIEVEARFDDTLNGRIRISLTFDVRATNSRHNIVYPFYLDEGTLVRDMPDE